MLDRSWPAVAVTLVVITAATQFLDGTTAASIPGGAGGCPLTQFRCATGHCVNLNVFCDGRNDCGDNSDEPAQCTRKLVPSLSPSHYHNPFPVASFPPSF